MLACNAPSKKGRIWGGIIAFGWSGLMFITVDMVQTFNYNIWYSKSADELLETSIDSINSGNADIVSQELSVMRSNLKVTYESKGNFKEAALDTTKRIHLKSQQINKTKKMQNKIE